jgi:hypothetical protein
MGTAGRQFREDIESEILHRVKDESDIMTRAELEAIGVYAGLPKEQVEQEFLKLAGDVWAGHIHPVNGQSLWVDRPLKGPLKPWTTVNFPREWFQDKGLVPRPTILD